MRLEGKVALVTGGGSGIGAAICERFSEEGAVVFVTDINEDSARSTADKLSAQGLHAVAMQQDVTVEQRWSEVLVEVIQQCGQLDVLVNNAGIAILGTAEDTSLEDWHKVQQVNLNAVFLGTREAIKVMKTNQAGSIINVASVAGMIGLPFHAAYNASKGGVRIFTKSAALHCADNQYNIRINSLHPGYIETPMIIDGIESQNFAEPAEFKAGMLSTIPLGTMGKPVDVANAALFLASDESQYITGSELVVDGGLTAR